MHSNIKYISKKKHYRKFNLKIQELKKFSEKNSNLFIIKHS